MANSSLVEKSASFLVQDRAVADGGELACSRSSKWRAWPLTRLREERRADDLEWKMHQKEECLFLNWLRDARLQRLAKEVGLKKPFPKNLSWKCCKRLEICHHNFLFLLHTLPSSSPLSDTCAFFTEWAAEGGPCTWPGQCCGNMPPSWGKGTPASSRQRQGRAAHSRLSPYTSGFNWLHFMAFPWKPFFPSRLGSNCSRSSCYFGMRWGCFWESENLRSCFSPAISIVMQCPREMGRAAHYPCPIISTLPNSISFLSNFTSSKKPSEIGSSSTSCPAASPWNL